LASAVGKTLPGDLPFLVAAARLRAWLGTPLRLPAHSKLADQQRQLIDALATDPSSVVEEPRDSEEAEAWIAHLRLKRRWEALQLLALEAGDIVARGTEDGSKVEEVSSIGDHGRVYFKGGHGAGAWPDELTVRCRKSDLSEAAFALRKEAQNAAALRARAGAWSVAKRNELSDFAATAAISEEEVYELETVVETAKDEKPIQKFLERHPHLLAALLSGGERFCIPQARLGGKYVPDFLIAEAGSLGIWWVLVELETPNSRVTLKTDGQLDKHARKGVAQVQEWREWIQENLSSARKRKAEEGLGLIDIRPRAPGLVLVGRRAQLGSEGSAARKQCREDQDIEIHTYDWLIETLRTVLTFKGPPGANSHLLHPSDLDGREQQGWA